MSKKNTQPPEESLDEKEEIVLPEVPEANNRLINEIKKVDDSKDRENFIRRIDEILDVKMTNEKMIHELLNQGVNEDKITVERAAAIGQKSKDSISELIKIRELLKGNKAFEEKGSAVIVIERYTEPASSIKVSRNE